MSKYENCQVVGGAIKHVGEVIRPYIKDNPELLKVIDSIKTPAQESAFYPLSWLVMLFEIASQHDRVDRLARTYSTNSIRHIVKRGGVDSPQTVLKLIESSFRQQHKGDVGILRIDIKNNQASITDSTYAPCGYLITLIERTIKAFGAINIKTEHPETNCRIHGSKSCRYVVSWEEGRR